MTGSSVSGQVGEFARKSRWLYAIDLALLATCGLMVLPNQPVLALHFVFVFLTVGAFFWSLRQLAVRSLVWVTIATGLVARAMFEGTIQLGELIDIPLLLSVLGIVYFIADRRSQSRRQIEFHKAVRAITEEAADEHDLNTLLTTLLRRSSAFIGADGGSVWTWDASSEMLQRAAWVTNRDMPAGPEQEGARLGIGEAAAGRAIAQRRGIIINNYQQSDAIPDQFRSWSAAQAVMTQPMTHRGRLIGAITIVRYRPNWNFSPRDLSLLGLVAEQASALIEHARLVHEGGGPTPGARGGSSGQRRADSGAGLTGTT